MLGACCFRRVPKQACRQPGCDQLTASGYCDGCRRRNRKEDARPTAAQRGYGSMWQRARAAYLAAHPVCVDPYRAHGEREAAATVVDHIVPHRGDYELFWDSRNWQPLCRTCHGIKIVREDGGFGNPLGGSVAKQVTINGNSTATG